MRVATLIIGLMLVLGLFFQSVLVGGLSEVAGDENSSSAAAVGVLMALIWIFGCALVIPLPRIAGILFVLAGVLGFAASVEFPDLGVWAAFPWSSLCSASWAGAGSGSPIVVSVSAMSLSGRPRVLNSSRPSPRRIWRRA